MNRTELCSDCGMLFLFPDEKIRSFWMKNTLIPLEMLFLSADFQILDIIEAEPCQENPCKIYASNLPAKYVLELNKDYSKNHNLKINDKIIIKNTILL